MVQRLSDILLFSDLDDTLFDVPNDPNCLISKQNREAVCRFVSEGGHFAIASGRAHFVALGLTGDLAINFPSVFVNGGYIYDTNRNEIMQRNFIDTVDREEIRKVVEGFDCVDAAVYYNDNGQFSLLDSELPEIYTGEIYGNQNLKDIECGIYKYMIFTHPKKQKALLKYLTDEIGDKVDIVSSATYFLELMPRGVSKASGIRKLVESTGWSMDNVVAVGDYYNDIEMLDEAGTAVCVENAPDDLKTHADLCVKSCKEHGVADLIERLESMYL